MSLIGWRSLAWLALGLLVPGACTRSDYQGGGRRADLGGRSRDGISFGASGEGNTGGADATDTTAMAGEAGEAGAAGAAGQSSIELAAGGDGGESA